MFFASSNLTHHYFASVGSYPYLQIHAFLGTQFLRVAPDLSLHPQCRKQCALGMVFVCDWCAEEGEDAVAGGLRDVAAVTLHRLHHQLECRIDDGAGFLGIEVLDQVHGAFEVGEQRGDDLALALGRRSSLAIGQYANQWCRVIVERWRCGC